MILRPLTGTYLRLSRTEATAFSWRLAHMLRSTAVALCAAIRAAVAPIADVRSPAVGRRGGGSNSHGNRSGLTPASRTLVRATVASAVFALVETPATTDRSSDEIGGDEVPSSVNQGWVGPEHAVELEETAHRSRPTDPRPPSSPLLRTRTGRQSRSSSRMMDRDRSSAVAASFAISPIVHVRGSGNRAIASPRTATPARGSATPPSPVVDPGRRRSDLAPVNPARPSFSALASARISCLVITALG